MACGEEEKWKKRLVVFNVAENGLRPSESFRLACLSTLERALSRQQMCLAGCVRFFVLLKTKRSNNCNTGSTGNTPMHSLMPHWPSIKGRMYTCSRADLAAAPLWGSAKINRLASACRTLCMCPPPRSHFPFP